MDGWMDGGRPWGSNYPTGQGEPQPRSSRCVPRPGQASPSKYCHLKDNNTQQFRRCVLISKLLVKRLSSRCQSKAGRTAARTGIGSPGAASQISQSSYSACLFPELISAYAICLIIYKPLLNKCQTSVQVIKRTEHGSPRNFFALFFETFGSQAKESLDAEAKERKLGIRFST